jgi:hypothetical protein
VLFQLKTALKNSRKEHATAEEKKMKTQIKSMCSLLNPDHRHPLKKAAGSLPHS